MRVALIFQMQKPFFLIFVLAFLGLACAPLSQMSQVVQTLPTQFPQPTAPAARVKSGTPTRAIPVASFNGVALKATTTAHENIFFAPNVPAAFQQTISADTDITAKRLMADLGWSGAPRVNVYVFSSRTAWLQGIGQIGGLPQSDVAFQANLQGDAWITIGGTAHPGTYLYPIPQSQFETLHMVAHEYTHSVQQQTLGGNESVPDWFLEGMAEAEGWRIAATQYPKEYAPMQTQIQSIVTGAAKEKKLFSLTSLATPQAWQVRMERPFSATLEYAESQMAVEYLQKLKGVNAPINVLIMTVNTGDFTTAFQQTAGMSLAAFEAKFFASLK
jgi:hypothetical protein